MTEPVVAKCAIGHHNIGLMRAMVSRDVESAQVGITTLHGRGTLPWLHSYWYATKSIVI